MNPLFKLELSPSVFLGLALLVVQASASGAEPPLPTGQGAIARLGTAHLFHPGGPRVLAFSPDGKILASGGFDNKVRLWDPVTGKPLGRLDGHDSRVETLAFSPDGKILASATVTLPDLTILLWDTATRKSLRTLQANTNGTLGLVFAPDGQTLVSAGHDGTVCVWETATGKERLRFQPYARKPSRLAFSPDGRILFTGAAVESEIRLWDPVTGKKLRHIQAPPGGLQALAVSRDGKTLAAACSDRHVRLWDVATGTEQRLWKVVQPTESVAFAADDKLVAAGTWKGLVYVWETASGKEIYRLPEYKGLAFAPDGKTLALGCGSSIRLWDLGAGKDFFPPQGHQAGIKAIGCSLDGSTLTTVSLDNTVRVWDSVTGKETRRVEDARPVYWTAGLTPDSRIFALALATGTGCLWDSVEGKELYRFKMGKGSERTACSADGKILATLLPPATVILLDVPTGEVLGRVHAAVVVRGIALSADARTLATTSEVGTDLWDGNTGNKLQRLKGQSGLTAAFSADGKLLAVGENTDKIKLWDVASGKELRQLKEVGLSGFAKIKIAPGGRALAAVGMKGELTLWDTLTGKLLAQNQDRNNPRRPFAFAPDGLKLALGWEDQTVRVWDSLTGQEIRRFHGHEDEVSAVAFTPDSRRLISGGLSGTALVWDLVDPGAGPRELRLLWEDLGSKDALRADRAFWSLAASPVQAVTLARARLVVGPAKGPSPRQLLADLDHDDFAKREQAQRELARLAGKAEPALRAALEDKPSPEVRRRIAELLEGMARQPQSLAPLPPAILRLLRVLEQAGTGDARAFLEKLADGIEDMALATEAHAALGRLKNRRMPRP